VWSALTDPDRLGRWLGRVRRGRFVHGERLELDLGAMTVPVTVQVLEPERRLELDWQAPGEDASTVRFELAPHGNGTMLVLEHSRLDERACMRYGGTWTQFVRRLDHLLGGPAA
jgi:uncharacterized protein YndB with AHSA1/START domain